MHTADSSAEAIKEQSDKPTLDVIRSYVTPLRPIEVHRGIQVATDIVDDQSSYCGGVSPLGNISVPNRYCVRSALDTQDCDVAQFLRNMKVPS